MDELPEETANALDLDRLTLGDLAALNRLCQIIGSLKSPDDRKKLDAVMRAAHPDRIDRIQMLAENLELFDFVPDVHTPEEYGRYMIQQSAGSSMTKIWRISTTTISMASSVSARRADGSMRMAMWLIAGY